MLRIMISVLFSLNARFKMCLGLVVYISAQRVPDHFGEVVHFLGEIGDLVLEGIPSLHFFSQGWAPK